MPICKRLYLKNKQKEEIRIAIMFFFCCWKYGEKQSNKK